MTEEIEKPTVKTVALSVLLKSGGIAFLAVLGIILGFVMGFVPLIVLSLFAIPLAGLVAFISFIVIMLS